MGLVERSKENHDRYPDAGGVPFRVGDQVSSGCHGCLVEGRILESKWKKVGICRISESKKVVLLAIFELESHRWLIVDVGDLLDLIAGHRFDVPIYEREKSYG